MIDLDQVLRACAYLVTGGALVYVSHLATMNAVNDDIDDWRNLAVHAQAATAQCVTVLEEIDNITTDLINGRLP
jgi:hypothetical protein